MKSALLLFVLALPLAAQEEIISFDKWRVHEGDDPQWAKPDFDDSAWATSPAPRRHSTAQPFFAGTRWYRASGELPASLARQPLAIALSPLDEVFDVYINGTLTGTYGTWTPQPIGLFPRLLTFRIPSGLIKESRVHLAIRRWTGNSRTNFAAFAASGITQLPHAPEIGPARLLAANEELRAASNQNRYLFNLLAAIGSLLVGAISLGLYFAQKTSRQNLWLGLALGCEALAPLAGLAVSSSSLPLRTPLAVILVFLQLFAPALFVVFLASICPRLRRPLHLAAMLQAAVAVAVAFSYGTQWFSGPPLQQWTVWLPIAAAATTAIALLIERQEEYSSLLAFGVALPAAAQVWFSFIAVALGIPDASRYLYLGTLIVDPRSVARLILAITSVSVLYLRHRQDQKRQAILGQELAAARMVQESLLKGSDAKTPGLVVEIAYLPASEVGGDFYQELNDEDGSLLILVGDVSGKGMRAALLVGHISGALSNERSRRPAEVLAHLNDSLVGRVAGGFVTSCCARIDPSGAVTLANAGHLPPYCGGQEVEVECGLPLGVVRGVQYAETRMDLGRNVPFLLLSDGVVEAANSAGELFGFDRTREISGKPAAEIAEAAKAWGQNDDITVVTVRRVG